MADAQHNSYPQSAALLLKAARLALDTQQPGESVTAIRLLRALPLSNADEYATSLAEIEIDVLAKRYQGALNRLAKLPLAPTPTLRREAGLLRAATLEATEQRLPAARERIAIADLLVGAQHNDNASLIWRDLGELSAPTLAALDRPTATGAFGAWIALANLHYGAISVEDRKQRFLAWTSRWKDTIAAVDLPTEVRAPAPGADQRTQPQTIAAAKARAVATPPAGDIHTVALLLPMTGPLASASRAVRDGFMAALFDAPGSRPRVLIFDTAAVGIETAYRNALGGGAEFIVGPLDKSDLLKLNAARNLAVPTLALNYLPPGTSVTANLVQFGLAPEDEAREVAERAFADAHRAVLVLSMRADWAARASSAFTQRWLQLGGQVVEQVAIGDQSEVERQVKNALLIPESQARLSAVTQALAAVPEFHDRSRRDIDAIVLFAKRNIARSINPTLKYHFASELAVYATSVVYGEVGGGSVDNDLDGIRFCDTPWHLQGDPLRTQLRGAFPRANADLTNLHALGVDAFSLQAQIKSLIADDSARMNGATGILSMGDSARIARELSWAWFVNGTPRPLPNTAQ